MPRAVGAHALRYTRLLVLAVLAAGCSGGDDGGSGVTTPASRPIITTAPAPRTTTTSTVVPATSTTTSSIAPTGEPAWRGDFPDPYLLVDGDQTYAYATQAGLIRIQRLVGDTPWALSDLGEALAATPAWAEPYSTWAPAVLHRGDRYLLFYSALVAGTDRHCIGRAVASSPTGPYVDDTAQPFLCPMELGGAIDPSPFVDVDGRVYLLWKNDGITLRREAALWSLPLTDDASGAAGPSSRLLDTDQRWEYPHIEAPSMARVGETYWLAYSGNWWNDAAYGTGLARCAGPLGPCTKPLDAPVLASRPGAYGPGGLEFFRDAGGELLVAYHAWLDTPGYPGSRALWISPVDTTRPVPTM